VPLGCLTGAAFQRYPLVAGQRETIRFLCSYADEVPPSPFPYQSQPVVTDYREFRHLWVVDGNFSPDIFMAQVGMRMAELICFERSPISPNRCSPASSSPIPSSRS
jgi:hypothetical protein